MSIRSSRGPDIRLRYRCISFREFENPWLSGLKYPEGLGFILATSIKLLG
jgi:hypothetical protein